MDIAKEKYDEGYEEDEIHSYMAIYKTVYDICSEQRSIVDKGADLVLSSIFCALPLLQEVRLSPKVLEDDGCLLSSDMIIEDFYEHHLQVVSSAIQSAIGVGVDIHTVSLLDFTLPCRYSFYQSWEKFCLPLLFGSLEQLLKNIKVLRLRGVHSGVLELLSHCALDLHHLDMCGVVASEKVIKDLFETNKKSLRSIRLHDVELFGLNHQVLPASILCHKLLGVLPTMLYRVADCDCPLQRKEGWWPMVGDSRSQLSTGTSAKRKYDELLSSIGG